FTDPSVNFGGEHFGVGVIGTPTAVRYSWLLDDGSGNLIHGPNVYISTPSFTYVPPAAGLPGNVVAVVVPPEPVEAHPFEFGEATWVKEIKTTTHNAHKVRLRELVADDAGLPQPWANNEHPEVEIEWRILQTEFAGLNGGKNRELAGAPEDLPGGDETITRRYEFYKYVGPYDAETHEAMADLVRRDGIHGSGIVTYADHFDPTTGEWVPITVNLRNVVVVGDFFGAQMAGFDIAPDMGLIDHVNDYPAYTRIARRKVVIGGSFAFVAGIKSGTLPPGLVLDSSTGILSGKPTLPGVYDFTVEAADLGGSYVSMDYTVTITGDAPVTYTIATSASPAIGGNVFGAGTFHSGVTRTVKATPKVGYAFIDWTEAGVEVSTTPSYTFTLAGNRDLVAHFAKIRTITTSAFPSLAGATTGGGRYADGTSVTVDATANPGYMFIKWTEGATKVSSSPTYTFVASANRTLVARFAVAYTISATASPLIGGSITGAGVYRDGTNVTLIASPAVGYKFVNWTENGVEVGTLKTLKVTASADHNLVANFVLR
ncbi:MAG TPA: putative Ig domain-containing protein, partial [Roseimicrobium sp.]|nr:putative Ig domain-containing protein [Roseimicrobium sp.]